MKHLDARIALILVPVIAVVMLVLVSNPAPSGAPDLPTVAGSAENASPTTVAESGEVSPFTMPSKVPDGITVRALDYGPNATPELIAALDRAATIKAYRAAQASAADQLRTGSRTAPGVVSPAKPGAVRSAAGPIAGVDTTAAADDLGGGLPVASFLTLVVSMVVIGIGAALAFRRRPAALEGAA